MQLRTLVEKLEDDELDIALHIFKRLDAGRKPFGAWSVYDGRDYVKEAREECVDLALYLTAEVIRLGRS